MKMRINNRKTNLAILAERTTTTPDEFSGKPYPIVEKPKYNPTVYQPSKTIDETQTLLKIDENGDFVCQK